MLTARCNVQQRPWLHRKGSRCACLSRQWGCICPACDGIVRPLEACYKVAAACTGMAPFGKACMLPTLLHVPDPCSAVCTDRSASNGKAASSTHRALGSGPVMLAEADQKVLLSTALKSGKDLIQTPFGNLPEISDKVSTQVTQAVTPSSHS